MLTRWKGCHLGAAIGDALGMARESNPPTLRDLKLEYRRAYKSHPNADLHPGQYTDDTQIMLLISKMIADGNYSEEKYAAALRNLYASGQLRFPDASVAVACDRLVHRGLKSSGVNSNTAGCICVSVPFALAFSDPIDVRESVVKACSVTHIHPAAYAASVAVAFLLHNTLYRVQNAMQLAVESASLENTLLAEKIQNAIRLGEEGISLEASLERIGNDISVFQTVPLAFYLINRYGDPGELLAVAGNVGGNTDTIGFICGAYAGARYGVEAFPTPLLDALESRSEIDALAERLFTMSIQKD